MANYLKLYENEQEDVLLEAVVEAVTEKYGGKYWNKGNLHRIYFSSRGKVNQYLNFEVVSLNEKNVIVGSSYHVYYNGKSVGPKWEANYLHPFREHLEEISRFVFSFTGRVFADQPESDEYKAWQKSREEFINPSDDEDED